VKFYLRFALVIRNETIRRLINHCEVIRNKDKQGRCDNKRTIAGGELHCKRHAAGPLCTQRSPPPPRRRNAESSSPLNF